MAIGSILARGGLVAGATLLSLLACEALARWTPLVRVAVARSNAVPWLTRDFYRLVDGCGYEIIPHATAEISNLGMRGPDRAATKPAGVKRILVVGDSVAYGIGVGAEQTFSAVLEKILATYHPDAPVEVLNSGVAGYNTAQELAFLEQRGFALEPDAIVLAYCPNDVLVTPIVFKDGDRMRFFCPDREIGGFDPLWLERSSLLRLYVAATQGKGLGDETGRPQGVDHDSAYEALRRLVRAARERGIPVLSIVFPLLAWEFDAYDAGARRIHDDVAHVLAAERVPTIDLLAAWREIGAKNLRSLELKGGDPLHPNARGHEDVARRVYAHLLETDWLKLGSARPPKRP